MRRLASVLAVLALAPLAALSVPSSPASADPVPSHDPYSGSWPTCGVAPDDDNRYCVISVTRNGLPVSPRVLDEEHEEPYIDSIGPGTVRFGVSHFPAGSYSPDGDADPSATWRWRVNTGAIHGREMQGIARNADLTVGGNRTSGYTFDLTLQPSPIAHRFYDPGFTCGTDSCGDDTTQADLEYAGFVTGYVTDLTEDSFYDRGSRARRTGAITASGAQASSTSYDAPSNTIVVRLANPHLRADGVTPVTSSFETFIPDDALLVDMGVPDPSSLTGGSFQVTRAGLAAVPFTLVHEPGGIRIRITGVTFSTPTYRLRARPSRPGRPTLTQARRQRTGAVRVAFRAPVADGGVRVGAYDARCRRGSGAWHRASGPRSSLRVLGVPRGRSTCQVRAVNRIGRSAWSPARRVR